MLLFDAVGKREEVEYVLTSLDHFHVQIRPEEMLDYFIGDKPVGQLVWFKYTTSGSLVT